MGGLSYSYEEGERFLVVNAKILYCLFLTSQRLGCLTFEVLRVTLDMVIDQERHIGFS